MKIKELWSEFGRRFSELFNGLAGNCPNCGCAESEQTFVKNTVVCCKCRKTFKIGA